VGHDGVISPAFEKIARQIIPNHVIAGTTFVLLLRLPELGLHIQLL